MGALIGTGILIGLLLYFFGVELVLKGAGVLALVLIALYLIWNSSRDEK